MRSFSDLFSRLYDKYKTELRISFGVSYKDLTAPNSFVIQLSSWHSFEVQAIDF